MKELEMVYVKNAVSPIRPSCPCGSWKQHYRSNQDFSPSVCLNQGCYRRTKRYVHVSEVYGDGENKNLTFVVALCEKCANSPHYKDISIRKLTSTNLLSTCKKKKRMCILF